MGVVLLEDESEVVEAGERHNNGVHNGIEVVNVHRSNAVLIAAATKSEQLEEDTLLIFLAMRTIRKAHGEDETDADLDCGNDRRVPDLEVPNVGEVGEDEEEEEDAHGEIRGNEARQHAGNEEDVASSAIERRGRPHVEIARVAALLLGEVATHLQVNVGKQANHSKHSHEEKEYINEPVHDLEVDESAQENVIHAWVRHQELRDTRRQHVVDESNEKNVAVCEWVGWRVLDEQVLRPPLRRNDDVLVELLRGHADHVECGQKEEDNRHDRGIHENPDDDQHILNEDADGTIHEVIQAT